MTQLQGGAGLKCRINPRFSKRFLRLVSTTYASQFKKSCLQISAKTLAILTGVILLVLLPLQPLSF